MRFSELTTLGVGGEITRYHQPATRPEAIAAIRRIWSSGGPWLVLGGGSNLVVSDAGFDGDVLHVAWRGKSKKRVSRTSDEVLLTVQAGEDWDGLVRYTISEGLQGLESLSGIPGLSGASVIQNIGAYGHDVAEVLESIEFLDYADGEEKVLPAGELELGHRTSRLKTGELQGVVLAVTFRLRRSENSLPVAYAELANHLGVEEGAQVALADLRDSVLALRRRKGMVVDPADRDSRSVGSFFVNPVVTERFAYSLPASAPKWLLHHDDETILQLDSGAEQSAATLQVPEAHGQEAMVKLSAAWLIEHAGINRGFSLPGGSAAVSGKHTLAITNPGGADAESVISLARYIRTQVANTFGVVLQPEPTLVGVNLD